VDLFQQSIRTTVAIYRKLSMKQTRKAEDEVAIRSLAERLLLMIQFFRTVEESEEFDVLHTFVQSAASAGNLRHLKLVSRDVERIALGLAPNEREGLEALLHHRLGIDKDTERAALHQTMAKVLERGSVASEKERRRIEEYVELLEATGGDAAEIAAFEALLSGG
jgi:hypothetical protein